MATAMVTIRINGEPRGVSEDMTISGLLDELNIKSDRVAVELNLEIVDRQAFDSRRLKEGDRIEILSFIGGGTI
jgi:sulfur carrier protein